MTKKQKKEIDFLKKVFRVSATSAEEKEYIEQTVKGKGKNYTWMEDKNPLFTAKRKLDINIKMWREDLTKGFLSAQELKEDFNCEYGNKLVDSILKSVTPEYRYKILSKGEMTILSFTNFPVIKEKIIEALYK